MFYHITYQLNQMELTYIAWIVPKKLEESSLHNRSSKKMQW